MLQLSDLKQLIHRVELLLRFGLAWHPETNRNWAFPTLRKTTGFGYYVNFKREILQVLQKGGNTCERLCRAVPDMDWHSIPSNI